MKKTRCIIVGVGGFARYHISAMLKMKNSTKIVGLIEPNQLSRQKAIELFEENKVKCPPFYENVLDFIKSQETADAALICSPHKYHFDNAKDCMEAGMDVCIEKPMVMNASEAKKIISLRDRLKRLVVVAFPGSLSPAIKKAKEMIKRGEIGKVSAISAYVYQKWKTGTKGTWRQNPEISGGGFLFDTGSHMLNTVVDIVGEDIKKVKAIFDNCNAPVEINSSITAVSISGIMISMLAAGDSVHCSSEIIICGDKGIMKTGIWGERLLIKREKDPDFSPVKYEKSRGVWEQFLKVREGKINNPCPAEVGLRFAKLMDMIKESAK